MSAEGNDPELTGKSGYLGTWTVPSTAPPAPAVTISVSPASVSLNAGQSSAFTASVAGSTNTAVTWSLNPAVGFVSPAGVYTAPASIPAQQNITITATSSADSSKQASAVVTLVPPPVSISVAVNPQNATLFAAQTQAFTATVTGTANTAVTWSISPSIGGITPAGVYTAPASILSPQTVDVRATSAADPSKSAIARISLSVTNKPLLPVEVVGPQGTTREVSVSVPSYSGTAKLWMQVHNVTFNNKMSVQVNNSAWMPVTEQTAALPAFSMKYGGFGGGFNTHKITMTLPAGVLTPGVNTIRFKHNQADGFSHGFRVLKLDVLDGNNASLGVLNQFDQENPNTWQPPINTPAAIAEGKRLFQSQPLVGRVPNNGSIVPIRARCGSCHSYDGRDLKYFNMSNAAIRTSAMAHGLTSEQGDMIASYIRSLPYPNPGRVWNPPYQPGPGMDSKPVVEWSAGAGIDAVLDRDADTLDYIMPGGDTSKVPATANLSAREIPIAQQLPDWLHWLPKFHPEDVWGDQFVNNDLNKYDLYLRSSLRPDDANAYRGSGDLFKLWIARHYEFLSSRYPSQWTADYASSIYGLAQLSMIRLWTINQQFRLEPMAREVFGSQADERAWFSAMPFITSPNMLALPRNVGGVANGRPETHTYFAFIWYQLQLILNNSNKRQDGNSPIDWGYSYGFIDNMSYFTSPPQAGIQALWLIKGLQVLENGVGPERGRAGGWMYHVADPSRMVTPGGIWSDVPASKKAAFADAYVRSWFARVKAFSPTQWYQGGWANTSEPIGRLNPDGSFGERLWYMIPRVRFLGVDPALMNQIVDWAKTIWPQAPWDQLKTSGCYTLNSTAVCSTDGN